MRKKETKKEQNNNKPIFHSIDRVLLLCFPMALTILILMLFGQISPLAAFIGFLLAFGLMFILALPFLHELDILIYYLKQEAQGRTDIETPRFAKSRREAFKIAESFNEIKMSWLIKNKVLEAQSLSDSAILEELPDPLLQLNEMGDIVTANLAARQLLGGGITFKRVSEVINIPLFLSAFHKVAVENSPNETVEFSARFKNKQGVYKVRLQKLPAATKNGAKIVAVLHDVTTFRSFEKSQTAFFANASHELKTPLSVLSGFIETLQSTAKDDPVAQEKFLKIMAEQTTHMRELVEDLLALSRMGLNTDQPKNDTILMPEIIQSVFQTLALKAEQNEQKLVLETIHLPPPIKGRSPEISRIFQNLIDNAIKYGRKRSTITVRIELISNLDEQSQPRQEISISVHNTGKTIAAEEIQHLTERFYRSPQTSHVPGTGLGLAIASELIASYDGALKITSQPRKGTTFQVLLPVLL